MQSQFFLVDKAIIVMAGIAGGGVIGLFLLGLGLKRVRPLAGRGGRGGQHPQHCVGHLCPGPVPTLVLPGMYLAYPDDRGDRHHHPVGGGYGPGPDPLLPARSVRNR